MNFIKRYWAELSIIALTILSFLAHLYNISFQCLEIDEQFTASVVTNHTLPYVVKFAITQDCNPPLYYISAWFSSQVLHEVSPLSLRLPAIIFCALLVPVYYLAGKELHNKITGVMTAAVTLCIFPFWFYSQDARAYTLVTLLFGCFVYFYIRMYRGDKSYLTVFFGALSASLCLYSHYYAIVPLGILFGFLFLKDGVLALSIGVQSLILSSPLIWSLQWIEKRPLSAFHTIFTSQQLILYTPNELLGWSWIIFVPLIAYSWMRSKEPLVKVFIGASVLTWVSMIPFGILTLIAPRYILLLSPLLVLCAMIPVSEIIMNQKTNARKFVLAMALLFFILVINCMSIMTWLTFSYCSYVT